MTDIDLNVVREQLIKAKSMLTKDTWKKGMYFHADGCMCAHGAAQVASNPVCASRYNEMLSIKRASASAPAPAAVAASAAAGVAAASAVAVVAAASAARRSAAEAVGVHSTGAGIALSAWRNRPNWVTELNASSYILGAVGLTAQFNDSEDTELGQVLSKFDQAIDLAERLAVLNCEASR